MCACIYIYIHTYIHIYIYTYIHIYIHGQASGVPSPPPPNGMVWCEKRVGAVGPTLPVRKPTQHEKSKLSG